MRSEAGAENPGSGPVLLTVGRINLDLFADPGTGGVRSAAAFRPSVGGSPTNTAIAARRLGVPSAVLTAVGADEVGDLVLDRLSSTGVNATWVRQVPGRRTSMAFLATLSADVGERVFYRQAAADTFLGLEDVATLPWGTVSVVLLSLDSLASGTTPAVVRQIAAEAKARGVAVWWDLDLRPDSWRSSEHYRSAGRPALVDADLLIGTEEEFSALLGVTAPPDHDAFTQEVRHLGAPVTVLKRGARGATLIQDGRDDVDVPAAATQVVCTVGGGDSTTGALVAARLAGAPWPDALRVAMRAAAHTVAQPGCSQGFPSLVDLGLTSLAPASLTRSLTPQPAGQYVHDQESTRSSHRW